MAKKIICANYKGGVGKSVTTHNLAAALTLGGRDQRVLVVDYDPQATVTKIFGYNPKKLQAEKKTLLHALFEGDNLRPYILKGKRYDLLPSSRISIQQQERKEVGDKALRQLRTKLAQVDDEYDFSIFDCPPSEGRITANAMAIADGIIIPVSTDIYAVQEVPYFIDAVIKTKAGLNPNVSILGALPTVYHRNETHDNEWLETLRRFCAQKNIHVFDPIRYSPKYKNAAHRDMAALERHRITLRNSNYFSLADHIIEHYQLTQQMAHA